MDLKGGRDISVTELFEWIASIRDIEGLTLSGGEPTEQMPALLNLLGEVRCKTGLSIILFSGRTLEKILNLSLGNDLATLIDILIDGRYDNTQKHPPGEWPSSANQKIHFFTPRYSLADFYNLPFFETWITEKGEIIESGFI
jgi:anaerobic ribonucleoside-triphosphate reductase activating protein